ncbi:flagellar export chaperone FliS [Galbitalea soli]|uniref:Flagellar export chaperone FliS n=1 Tax=Galbitalea soli TaxID=1268042 RepID=A0A7C9PN52_9MICO|nr:flagellar export chaperone FliS [Galbitalea soli]NEM91168.1 flagellar export chaperone FliS [Galbitalea soli]NYJ29857.1 flagellar protein FliS [Galbitalea soli]
MSAVLDPRSAYRRDSVMTATPAALLTMLYDRLLLDLQWAESAQQESDWAVAGTRLLHAQDIVTELIGSLKPELWTGGPALLAVYVYVLPLLRAANVERSVDKTREAIQLLDPLRQAWREAAETASTAAPTATLSAVG